MVVTPHPGLPNFPVASPRLMADSTLSTPLVLLDAAGVQQHPGGRRAPPLGRLLDARGGHARHGVRPLRGHVRHRRGGLVEVDGVGVDERTVEPIVADQLVQHRAEQGRVGTGPHPEEQVGGPGQGHDPGVLHDELRPPIPGPPDVAGRDGEGLGHVRPGHPHDVREGDVAPRVGGPVDAQCLLVPRAGRHHAVAAVVVEVGGLQRQPGELADQVALLVGERDARQHGDGVVAVGGLDAADLAHHAVESVVPRNRPEPAGRGGVSL
jgi:hypothetical protein